jgi:hypothetical protein
MSSLAPTHPAAGRTSRLREEVTDTLTIAVDAPPVSVREALSRIDPGAPLTRTLCALDAAGRLALAPARIGRGLGMIWRIDARAPAERVSPAGFDSFSAPGHVKVRWEVEVTASGADGTLLSIVSRFTATDERSRGRLLDAWGVIGALSRVLVERAAHAVKSYAEELAEGEDSAAA